jgi:hypothetical protein
MFCVDFSACGDGIVSRPAVIVGEDSGISSSAVPVDSSPAFDATVDASVDGTQAAFDVSVDAVVDMVSELAADVEHVLCNNGYQRIIFDPSSDVVYCIPIIGTEPGHVANPCGYGQPYDYAANGIVVCSFYDGGM